MSRDSGLLPYVSSRDTDLLLAHWWAKMERDGDLPDLFTKSGQSLSSLYRIVGPGKTLLYGVDIGGIWVAFWFEPMMSGVFMGAWVAREHRRTRRALDAFLQAWELALIHHTVVIGVTRQREIINEHERLGYTVLGCLPGIWDGEDAWAVMLTRPAFVKTLARFRRVSARLEAVEEVSRA